MADTFEVREHIIEASYIREYPHATAHSAEETLRLAVKQYIPKDNVKPQYGDITIIGAHANGFGKELYEPFWAELHDALRKKGVRIRGIWIAQCAWQGQSGVLNENNLGNDPSWHDYSRDMLKLINDFRHEMPTPIVGIGHSFGANSLAWLSTLHPSLFTTVVLIDPVMSDLVRRGPAFGGVPTIVTAPRRDLWPSREEAAKALAKNKFYQAWDPRVFDLFIKYGLRDTPTKLYPSAPAGSVTLTTTKHQEVFTYGRGHEQNYDSRTGQRVKGDVTTAPVLDLNREMDHRYSPEWPFYRPEIPISAARLPSLRPSAFYLFGETSTVNWPAVREEKRQITGVGVGGSGGVKAGRVADATLSGLGHLLVFEDPKQCAEHVSKWLSAEMERWRKEDESRQAWYRSTEVKKDTMDEDWERWIAIAKPQLKPKI